MFFLKKNPAHMKPQERYAPECRGTGGNTGTLWGFDPDKGMQVSMDRFSDGGPGPWNPL
jgi:hypothetical protein